MRLKFGDVVHREPGLARHHVDIGGVLQRGVRELVLRVVEQPIGLVAAVIGFQIGLALLEGLGAGRLDALELQNVVAELGLHRPANLALLHAEGGIGERRHIHLALRPAEVAALLRRARILRELLRERREILAALRALQNGFGLGLDRRILLRIGDLQQDVPHAALLGLRIALRRLGLLLLEERLELRIIDAHVRGELGEAHLDIAQVHRFGRHVVGLVRIVIGLDGRLIGRRLGGILRGRQREPGELALLARECAQAGELGGGHETRAVEGHVELAQLHVAPEQRLDFRDRAALRVQHRERMRLVEFAVHLESRDLRHVLEQRLIADSIAELIGPGHQRLGVHVLIEHALLQLGALRVVERRRGLPLVLRELLLVGLPNLVARDLAAVHLRGVARRRSGSS